MHVSGCTDMQRGNLRGNIEVLKQVIYKIKYVYMRIVLLGFW